MDDAQIDRLRKTIRRSFANLPHKKKYWLALHVWCEGEKGGHPCAEGGEGFSGRQRIRGLREAIGARSGTDKMGLLAYLALRSGTSPS